MKVLSFLFTLGVIILAIYFVFQHKDEISVTTDLIMKDSPSCTLSATTKQVESQLSYQLGEIVDGITKFEGKSASVTDVSLNSNITQNTKNATSYCSGNIDFGIKVSQRVIKRYNMKVDYILTKQNNQLQLETNFDKDLNLFMDIRNTIVEVQS